MSMFRCSAATLLAGLLLSMAACTVTPEPKPIEIEEPVDAFNAVGRPHTPNNGRYRGGLSSDVQRLQDARRLYQLSQERQREAVERRQRLCRQHSDSRLVPVRGTPGKFVYCEPALNTRPADVD